MKNERNDYVMLKAKSRKEVAIEYGISVKTLRRWLICSEIKIPSGLISPNNLKIIYLKFGFPERVSFK